MDIYQTAGQKRLKAGTACTNCRRKKLRCTGTLQCARCVAHKLDCVVDEALFLKTNSVESLFVKTGTRAAPTSSFSPATSPLSPRKTQQQHQRHQSKRTSYDASQHSQHSQHTQHTYTHYVCASSPSSSCSGDEIAPQQRSSSADHLSDRRMSASSATSVASQSPGPSSPYSFHYSTYASAPSLPRNAASSSTQHVILSDPPSSAKGIDRSATGTLSRAASRHGPINSSLNSNNAGHSSGLSTPATASSATKKRTFKDQGPTKPRQKRKDSRQYTSDQDSDPLPSPLVMSQDPVKKENTQKSVVSTMSLDGHGQHFHGSSSGFYVCQMSSRFRQGVYPLPMAHLNDSDLWSHSLQITSERELPPKDVMETLLNLYFRYMYPFAPMFVRKTFMRDHHQNRPDLSQVLILNAIFCNACWYSDDPAVKQDSTKYFNRAKIIMDETYHVSMISTVQALLLMSHHQYATGNHSGGWLYTGMATRIALDIGLHRHDVHVDEPDQAEVRKRVWWALYISDRISSGVLGRPTTIRDETFNVEMPSNDWITEVIGEDVGEYPYEPETIISCRLLWSIKLFNQMGKVLNTMHCIEAEINSAFLAEISKTHLPRLHHSLTSWFLALPRELMYTPYTMQPGTNHPPSPPTALMHMFYYTCLTMLHRPYLRPLNSTMIDANFLVSSRNICTAAATNVCHIADSLMLHGQLRDTCYYGIGCLLAAGTVHVHNAIASTPSNRETTRAGLSKSVKAVHELVKTFPVAESLIAVALDVFASQTNSVPSEMTASFIDISTFVTPFMDLTQLQSTSIGNIYEAARLAKLAKDGPGPAPSIQLRHPYGNFSMPLPDINNVDNPTKLSALWQAQITTAIAMAAIAFGATDSLQNQQQQFFASPLELPEALRLTPIDSTLFSQVDTTTTGGLSTPLAAVGAGGGLGQHQGGFHFESTQHQQHQSSTQSGLLSSQQQQNPQLSGIPRNGNVCGNHANSSLDSESQSRLSQELSPTLSLDLQEQHVDIMKEDEADSPSPPVISSDDMDVESSCLSDDPGQSLSRFSSTTITRAESAIPKVPRQDVQTHCDATSARTDIHGSIEPAGGKGEELSHDLFISSLTKAAGHVGQGSMHDQCHLQAEKDSSFRCHQDVGEGQCTIV